MPDTHALLSPSSSDRWLHCAASARLAERITSVVGEEDTPYTRRGTELHDLAAKTILHRLGRLAADDLMDAIEQTEPTQSEVAMVDTYAEYVMTAYLAAGDTAQIFVETRFDMNAWAPDCFGTGDVVIVSDGLIHVIDFKTGSGVRVNAEGNSQMRLYALGAYDAFGSLYEPRDVKTSIVQPALDNISSETLPIEYLLIWGETIRDPARAAHKGQRSFCTGSWCRFCPALPVCPAQAERMTAIASALKKSCTPKNKTVSRVTADSLTETLGDLMSLTHALEDYTSKTKKLALRFAQAGHKIPGYSIGKKGLRRDTADEEFADLITNT